VKVYILSGAILVSAIFVYAGFKVARDERVCAVIIKDHSLYIRGISQYIIDPDGWTPINIEYHLKGIKGLRLAEEMMGVECLDNIEYKAKITIEGNRIR